MALLLLGFILLGYNGHSLFFGGSQVSRGSRGAYFLFTILVLLLTVIRFYPWHRRWGRGIGLEVHFEKTLVPTAYILVATNLVMAFWPRALFMVFFSCALLVVIQSVNCILLYFHGRDRQKLPPHYFSHLFAKEDQNYSLYHSLDS